LQGIGFIKLPPGLEGEEHRPAELEATMGKLEVFLGVVVEKTKCRIVVSRVLPRELTVRALQLVQHGADDIWRAPDQQLALARTAADLQG
jgi:hypothetical protein